MQSGGQIGVIGLGQMGLGMAETLVRAGERVLATDVAPERRALFAAPVSTAEELAAACQVILLSLPNSMVVENVMAAIMPHCAAGTLIIDTSTSDPDSTRRIHAQTRALGLHFVDAPVSGGAAGAAAGALFIMAGGDADALAQAAPLFDILGRETILCGGSGAGNVVKILNNALCAAHLALAGEALALGEKAGLSRELLAGALAKGSGRSGVFEVNLPKWVLSESYDSGFTMGLMRKDVRLFEAFAEANGSVPILLKAAAVLWRESTTGLADHDDFNRMVPYAGAQS